VRPESLYTFTASQKLIALHESTVLDLDTRSASRYRPPDWLTVLLLGALSVVTPFAIDMYLPAFSQVAAYFHTTTASVSWSLSTYFIGFAAGQILYGPLLDRFGRKRPLYVGVAVFILASLVCAQAPNIQILVASRFLQALGGSVAQVASIAMVRDFFPPEASAKIFSLLFLIIGLSPLLAPTVGTMVMSWLGWRAIFLLLAGIAAAVLLAVAFLLPEGHTPDPTISLKPQPILREFFVILTQPQFRTYAFAGAFSFAGLFAYVTGSPLVFMDGFRASAKVFGIIFACVTMGFIGGNQVNVFLLRKFSSQQIFSRALETQVAIGLLFVAGMWLGWWGMAATLVLFFLFLSVLGLTYPNAAALALAPFSRNMGSASALLGFIQMGTGALTSTGIGFFGAKAPITLLAASALLALMIYLIGKRFVGQMVYDEIEGTPVMH
jgi:DHA1 family bicyclomycin/chloramphenicol resistance-like MFS transporter